jgi:hypothetical protein
MGWCIEPHDYGVLETLVNTFTGYIIKVPEMRNQDFLILGLGRTALGWPGMAVVPTDEDGKPYEDDLKSVIPFAYDLAFEVY